MERYCPHCKSIKPMVKVGFLYLASGKKQRWICRNRLCGHTTTKPSKDR